MAHRKSERALRPPLTFRSFWRSMLGLGVLGLIMHRALGDAQGLAVTLYAFILLAAALQDREVYPNGEVFLAILITLFGMALAWLPESPVHLGGALAASIGTLTVVPIALRPLYGLTLTSWRLWRVPLVANAGLIAAYLIWR
ncbi:MAG: hypothetical protein HYZ09_02700 [Candidatus Kerfeldbacteria bacterium]|nr:hypothetical protein [Candidatus Kerfeldbacteria bacterium]